MLAMADYLKDQHNIVAHTNKYNLVSTAELLIVGLEFHKYLLKERYLNLIAWKKAIPLNHH